MDALREIEVAGFSILPGTFLANECAGWAESIESVVTACSDPSVSLRRQNGAIYGARNLLELFPAARTLWRREPTLALLTDVLGPRFGLVRGLFFDKSPGSNWSLPWHQDLTIAVQDNSLPTTCFRNPTRKAGVPHVEAPREVLEQMLTLRIHLDDVTSENGPLRVLAGSHLADTAPKDDREVTILATAGDVLCMRPLLYHSSPCSAPGVERRRRVIHLEFAGQRELPNGYQWHEFTTA